MHGRYNGIRVQAFTVRIVVTSYEIHDAPEDEDIFNYLDDVFSCAEELRTPEDCKVQVGVVEEQEFEIVSKGTSVKGK